MTLAAKKVSRHRKSETKLLTKLSRPILRRPGQGNAAVRKVYAWTPYACITVKSAVSKRRFCDTINDAIQVVEQ